MKRNAKGDEELEKLGWITAQQAAEIAGKDTSTIYRWARRGKIGSQTVGDGMVYIEEKSLNVFIGPLAVTRVKHAR